MDTQARGGFADASDVLALINAALDDVEPMFLAGLGASPGFMKPGGSLTTEADIAIEEYLTAKLSRDTGWPVVGEENGGVPSTGPWWVIDPVDGTTNFAAGSPLCATLVTLMLGQQPVAGAVAAPALGYRFTATAGGTLLNHGQPVSPPPTVHEIIGCGSMTAIDEWRQSLGLVPDVISAVSFDFPRVRITGSVGIDLAFAAAGIYAGAVTASPNVWDNSAGVLMGRCAGLTVTDITGNTWSAHSTGVIAARSDIHSTLVDIVAGRHQA